MNPKLSDTIGAVCRQLERENHPYYEALGLLKRATGRLFDQIEAAAPGQPVDQKEVDLAQINTVIDRLEAACLQAIEAGLQSKVKLEAASKPLQTLAIQMNRQIDDCRPILGKLGLELLPIAGTHPMETLIEAAHAGRRVSPVSSSEIATKRSNFVGRWVMAESPRVNGRN